MQPWGPKLQTPSYFLGSALMRASKDLHKLDSLNLTCIQDLVLGFHHTRSVGTRLPLKLGHVLGFGGLGIRVQGLRDWGFMGLGT